jgi:hypothetical protein
VYECVHAEHLNEIMSAMASAQRTKGANRRALANPPKNQPGSSSKPEVVSPGAQPIAVSRKSPPSDMEELPLIAFETLGERGKGVS